MCLTKKKEKTYKIESLACKKDRLVREEQKNNKEYAYAKLVLKEANDYMV